MSYIISSITQGFGSLFAILPTAYYWNIIRLTRITSIQIVEIYKRMNNVLVKINFDIVFTLRTIRTILHWTKSFTTSNVVAFFQLRWISNTRSSISLNFKYSSTFIFCTFSTELRTFSIGPITPLTIDRLRRKYIHFILKKWRSFKV